MYTFVFKRTLENVHCILYDDETNVSFYASNDGGGSGVRAAVLR